MWHNCCVRHATTKGKSELQYSRHGNYRADDEKVLNDKWWQRLTGTKLIVRGNAGGQLRPLLNKNLLLKAFLSVKETSPANLEMSPNNCTFLLVMMQQLNVTVQTKIHAW